jgi:hypothetical protein
MKEYLKQKNIIINFYNSFLKNSEIGFRKLGGNFRRNLFYDPNLIESEFEKMSKTGKLFEIHNSVEKYYDIVNEFKNDFVYAYFFVLDIDINSLRLSSFFAEKIYEMLKNINPNIKFSGNKGFHIFFEKDKEDISEKIEDYRIILNKLKSNIFNSILRDEEGYFYDDIELFREFLKALNLKSIKELKENNYNIIPIDSMVLSSRHLIRSPYSINLKSKQKYREYLVSGFISPDEVSEFITMNEDEIIQYLKDNFSMSNINIEENLKLYKDDYNQQEIKKFLQNYEKDLKFKKKIDKVKKVKRKAFKPVNINLMKQTIPKRIKRILEGGIVDGRKRAFFILTTFFANYNGKPLVSFEKFEEIIKEWNKRNVKPFKENELRSMLKQAKKQWEDPKYKTPSLDRSDWWGIIFKED